MTISRLTAIVIAAVVMFVGVKWGTYAAGGSDSYCYVNQAELFAHGKVREVPALASRVPWPNVALTFAPAGHVPSPNPPHSFVPMCPPGYSMMMAGVRLVAGRAAMFWVVPIFGGLAVWFTYLLGRRLGSEITGLVAAALLAASPVFLYQVVQPMSDIPALAMWTLALLAALPDRPVIWRTAILAGVASGAAVLVRVNLVPLAFVTGAAVCLSRPITIRAFFARGAAFAAGVLPFVAIVMALQNAMYGGPLKSGYGTLGMLFSASHLAPNLARYPKWLMETQTPFLALALVAPFVARGAARRRAWWLLAFAAATLACYLPYVVYDAWWFVRFLLPLLPPLLVLAVFVVAALAARLGVMWRALALVALTAALVVIQLRVAHARDVFRLQMFEQKYRDAGEYVSAKLPADALLLAINESGSLRFHGNRPTLAVDAMDPAWLDRAIETLVAERFHPYIVLESSEIDWFTRQFGSQSRIGALDWPPRAQIDRQVTIYDPADREAFLHGTHITTDIVSKIGR